jgi:hypothetical protein
VHKIIDRTDISLILAAVIISADIETVMPYGGLKMWAFYYIFPQYWSNCIKPPTFPSAILSSLLIISQARPPYNRRVEISRLYLIVL